MPQQPNHSTHPLLASYYAGAGGSSAPAHEYDHDQEGDNGGGRDDGQRRCADAHGVGRQSALPPGGVFRTTGGASSSATTKANLIVAAIEGVWQHLAGDGPEVI
jgi:hypothetical protein